MPYSAHAGAEVIIANNPSVPMSSDTASTTSANTTASTQAGTIETRYFSPAYSLLLNGNVNSVRRIGAFKSLRTMLPHTVENSIGMSITPVTYMSEKV